MEVFPKMNLVQNRKVFIFLAVAIFWLNRSYINLTWMPLHLIFKFGFVEYFKDNFFFEFYEVLLALAVISSYIGILLKRKLLIEKILYILSALIMLFFVISEPFQILERPAIFTLIYFAVYMIFISKLSMIVKYPFFILILQVGWLLLQILYIVFNQNDPYVGSVFLKSMFHNILFLISITGLHFTRKYPLISEGEKNESQDIRI
ncbi:MAG: hypothetical protein ACYCYI_04565 [Saccharofermentanales bacterium]